MKAIANGLVKHLAELALLCGAVLVAVGAGLIYLPAGLIAGGVLMGAGAVLSRWGGETEKGADAE